MPRKKTPKFKCEKCGKAFNMAMHLGRHMATAHGQTKSPPATKPRATKASGMAKDDLAGALAAMINKLQTQRQEHVDAIAEIDAVVEKYGIQLPERKRRGRPPGRKPGRKPGRPAAAATAPTKPTGRKGKRRARRKFAVSGLDLILAFVKSVGKKGATTSEIVKHWKSEGRSGDGYTTLSQLTKQKKLKKEKLKGEKGSRYRAA
ncbi:MAG TPA: C2H2-type zinc finger protein [Phycisphaerae bacterium]|nr:C2H2-type zinc finger protein [Phycisphaerae bacterium]HRY71159.1 C2H2-type zinc finger protein [Phycisphaerae bacterium]HSA30062.1 C2H2-type zinc finger protein [Phycisphaerae bacterium]